MQAEISSVSIEPSSAQIALTACTTPEQESMEREFGSAHSSLSISVSSVSV